MFKNKKKNNRFVWSKNIKIQTQIVKDDVFEDVVRNIYTDPTVIDISWTPSYDVVIKNNVEITSYSGMLVTVRYLVPNT